MTTRQVRRGALAAALHWPGHRWLALPARLYLGGVFVYASLHKLAFPASFALDIATYDILPLQLVNLLAIVLPYLELATGALLIAGLRSRAATLWIIAMMLVFIAALSLAMSKGLQMSCGCFASPTMAAETIGWPTLARDLAWLSLALYIFVVDRQPIGLEGLLRRRMDPQDTPS